MFKVFIKLYGKISTLKFKIKRDKYLKQYKYGTTKNTYY